MLAQVIYTVTCATRVFISLLARRTLQYSRWIRAINTYLRHSCAFLAALCGMFFACYWQKHTYIHTYTVAETENADFLYRLVSQTTHQVGNVCFFPSFFFLFPSTSFKYEERLSVICYSCLLSDSTDET